MGTNIDSTSADIFVPTSSSPLLFALFPTMQVHQLAQLATLLQHELSIKSKRTAHLPTHCAKCVSDALVFLCGNTEKLLGAHAMKLCLAVFSVHYLCCLRTCHTLALFLQIYLRCFLCEINQWRFKWLSCRSSLYSSFLFRKTFSVAEFFSMCSIVHHKNIPALCRPPKNPGSGHQLWGRRCKICELQNDCREVTQFLRKKHALFL